VNIVAARHMMLTGKDPGEFSRYDICTDSVVDVLARDLKLVYRPVLTLRQAVRSL
jgi:hypothetical protein